MDDNQKKKLHIGIILDGNRRYAKSRNIQAWEGHMAGARNVEKLTNWCRELGTVSELTLYSFSVENFKRPEKEKEYLFELFRRHVKKLEKENKDKKNPEKKIKVKFIGRLEMFPKDINKSMYRVMEQTKNNNSDTHIKVNFAMAYGGRAEIVDAVKKITNLVINKKIKPNEINEETVKNNLYLADEPDLIIRPGGEKRVSNFLIWQGSYSEWIFVNKFWPEFTKNDLIDAITEFQNRERRFGR